MKHISNSFRWPLVALGLFSFSLHGHAQNVQANDNAWAAKTQQIEDSRALLASGDFARAEARLFADNLARPGTGGWFLESGGKLMHLATSFANRRDSANARAIANQAIAKLQQAEKKLLEERKPNSASHAQFLIGALAELIFHDEKYALQAYQNALADAPTSISARNAVNRLAN